MSDQDEPARDDAFDDSASEEPGFDDPAFGDLRGRLAGVRVSEPVPDGVAARLDATLRTLRDQRLADESAAAPSVVPLRRRIGRMLVAAAAVVLVGTAGVGIVQSARDGSDSARSSSTAAGDQADSASVAPTVPGAEAAKPSTRALDELAAATRLRSAHFSRDVSRAMRTLALVDGDFAADAVTGGRPETGGSLAPAPVPAVTATPLTGHTAGPGCAGPDAPDAVTISATLDGVPVALVFHPPTPEAQLVEAWSCDGAALLASATVPQ